MGGWWINAEKCDIYGPLRSQPRLAQTLGSGPWFVTRILSKGVKTERDKLAETEMEEQELWDDIGDVIPSSLKEGIIPQFAAVSGIGSMSWVRGVCI